MAPSGTYCDAYMWSRARSMRRLNKFQCVSHRRDTRIHLSLLLKYIWLPCVITPYISNPKLIMNHIQSTLSLLFFKLQLYQFRKKINSNNVRTINFLQTLFTVLTRSLFLRLMRKTTSCHRTTTCIWVTTATPKKTRFTITSPQKLLWNQLIGLLQSSPSAMEVSTGLTSMLLWRKEKLTKFTKEQYQGHRWYGRCFSLYQLCIIVLL